MVSALLGMLLRHGLTILAGYLVTKGLADESSATAIAGGLSAAVGLGLSALNKVTVVQKLDAAAAKVGLKYNQ